MRLRSFSAFSFIFLNVSSGTSTMRISFRFFLAMPQIYTNFHNSKFEYCFYFFIFAKPCLRWQYKLFNARSVNGILDVPANVRAYFFMAQIQLRSRKTKETEYCIVDEQDFEWLNKYKWFKVCNGNKYYAQSSLYEDGKQKTVQIHRLIMNPEKGKVVDHIDGNGLNNSRSNLRIATSSQNSRNRGGNKNTSSKYKGVSLIHFKHCQKRKNGENKIYKYARWRAMINFGNGNKLIGFYKTEEEAALAYNKMSLKHHGEFAFINKIPDSFESGTTTP